MSNQIQTFASGDTITAAEFNQRAKDIENFVNGGIGEPDLYTGQWVDTKMVRPQKFFGSPAPRAEGATGDLHHRQTFGAGTDQFFLWGSISNDEAVPITGLAQTVHVVPKTPGGRVRANVMCSFYAREVHDGNQSAADGGPPELHSFANFALYVRKGNGPAYFQGGTFRRLYCSNAERTAGYVNRYGAKNLSIVASVELDHGINHVYVGARISGIGMKHGWRLHVAHRTMVVDVKYL